MITVVPGITKTCNFSFVSPIIRCWALYDADEDSRQTPLACKPATEIIRNAIDDAEMQKGKPPSLDDLRRFVKEWKDGHFSSHASSKLTEYLDRLSADCRELMRWENVKKEFFVFSGKDCQAAASSFYESWFAFGTTRNFLMMEQPGISLREKAKNYQEAGWIVSSSPVRAIGFGNSEIFAATDRTLLHCNISDVSKLKPEERPVSMLRGSSIRALDIGGNAKRIYLGTDDGRILCYYADHAQWVELMVVKDVAVTALAAFDNERSFVAAADRQGRLYYVDFYREKIGFITQIELTDKETVTGMMIAGDGKQDKYLLAMTSEGRLHIEDLVEGQASASLEKIASEGKHFFWKGPTWKEMMIISIGANSRTIKLNRYTPQ